MKFPLPPWHSIHPNLASNILIVHQITSTAHHQHVSSLLSAGINGYLCCHDMLPSSLVARHPLVFQIDRVSSPVDHHTHSIVSLDWYPTDNGLFVSLSMDKTLKIWDANRLKVGLSVDRASANKHSFQMVDQYKFDNFAYSMHMPSTLDSSMIAVAHRNGDVRLIDMRSGSDSHLIHAHRGRGICLVKWFQNSSHLLASAG
jgi:DNA excision repair protein ERCC-8